MGGASRFCRPEMERCGEIVFSYGRQQKAAHIRGDEVLFATEGEAFERTFSAFRELAIGRELLQQRPNFSALYASLAMLGTCPPGSLGQWYAWFMRDFGLTEEPYLRIAAEQAAPFADDPERAWFHLRFDFKS